MQELTKIGRSRVNPDRLFLRASERGVSYGGFIRNRLGIWNDSTNWTGRPTCEACGGFFGIDEEANDFGLLRRPTIELCEWRGDRVMIDGDKICVSSYRLIAADEDIPDDFFPRFGFSVAREGEDVDSGRVIVRVGGVTQHGGECYVLTGGHVEQRGGTCWLYKDGINEQHGGTCEVLFGGRNDQHGGTCWVYKDGVNEQQGGACEVFKGGRNDQHGGMCNVYDGGSNEQHTGTCEVHNGGINEQYAGVCYVKNGGRNEQHGGRCWVYKDGSNEQYAGECYVKNGGRNEQHAGTCEVHAGGRNDDRR